MKQHLFLRGAYMGAREIPTWAAIGDSPKPANSYVLFCPVCADIWGKLMHEHEAAYCQVVTSRCREHAIFPSDATFTVQAKWEGDPRDMGGADWPLPILAHDVGSLANFYLNNPDKYHHDPSTNS